MKVLIEKIVPGGQGLGTLEDGKKVFLWNALPGEVVTDFLVTKKKSHYLEGVAREFEKTAPERVGARDECYLSTSPWQVFDYEFELAQKRELVLESLRQEQITGVEVEAVRTDGKEWGYRNKMEYALYYDHNTVKIWPAFHERGSHRKRLVRQSSIERPEIFWRAMEVVEDLNARGEEARRYQSLLLRASADGKVAGGLYENGKPHPVFENLHDEILGREYSYSPNGFFQINLPVYEMALLEIQREVKTEKVLDLYAGVGTIGLSVARERDLTLVECNKEAFRELERNVSDTGARAVMAKSEEALEYIAPEMTVILDPPRAGCDKKLISRLLEQVPERVIYLSCNPATQARDVRALGEKYIMERIIPFNFFPKTPHIENLIIMRRI